MFDKVNEYLTEIWEDMQDAHRDNNLRFEGAINMALKAELITLEIYELWSYRIKRCPHPEHTDGRIWCAYCGDIDQEDAEI